MSTISAPVTAAASSVGIAGQPARVRVVSLDIFRGLTMALMIFVNDLSSVHGLSRWTYHIPTKVDAMSYVDMVFPAFLFIVGMAMPLAVEQRLRRNPSIPSLWIHVLLRSFALLVLGLVLANAHAGDPSLMHGFPTRLWPLIALLGAVLVWGVFGDPTTTSPRRTQIQQMVGAAILIACYAIFRRTIHGGPADGHVGWIDFRYPEILGLIGLTYFSASLLYIPLRKYRWAPLAWLGVLLVFDACCQAHLISLAHISLYAWPFGNGVHPALVMAGIFANTIFLGHPTPQVARWTPYKRIILALAFAVCAAILGYFLTPFGISKNRGTPTWCLWSIAACLVVFTAIYWLADVRKHTAWALPLRSAGSNTLLTYLLPDFYSYAASLFGLSALLGQWNHGWPGVLRAILFTAAMLLLSTLLTRARVRMQL
jgi:heparan-alpha-glucosaminide N-acetyltransferase